VQNVPTWKKVVAFLIDLIGSFFILGYIIGYFTGNLTSRGFNLNGGPAFLLFILIIVYFVVFNKFLGGTVGKRLFKI